MGYKFPPIGNFGFRVYRFLFKGKILCELFPNIFVNLNLNDPIQSLALLKGYRYEKPTPQILLKWLKENKVSTFFDIGANFGFFSYLVKSEYSSVNVYSFEPSLYNFKNLVATQELNKIEGFYPQNLGLSDENSILKFSFTLDDSGHSTFGDNPSYHNKSSLIQTIFVPVKRFDDWLYENEIDFPEIPSWVVKMDVEGYELKVLKGMAKSLEKKCFIALCLEISENTLNFCGASPIEVYDFLKKYNYVAYDENMKQTTPQKNEFRNVYFIYQGA